MTKQKNGFHIILFCVSLVFAACIVLYMADTFRTDMKLIAHDKITELNTGWYYMQGETKIPIEELPCRVKKEEGMPLTIYNTLPEELDSGSALYIKTLHQSLRIFIDGKDIYSQGFYSNANFSRSFGNLWNLIHIDPSDRGKQISIQLNSPYFKDTEQIGRVLTGNEGAVIFSLINHNFGTLCFCIFMMLLGILLIVFKILLTKKQFDSNGLEHLGIFSIMAAVWILTDSNILQFYTENNAVVYFTSFFTFMLMPVPMILFAKQNCSITIRKKIFDVLCILFIISFLIAAVLLILNIADLVYTVRITHVLMIVAIVLLIAIYLEEAIKYKNKNIILFAIGIGSLCICGILDLIGFYVSVHEDNSFFFRMGLCIFIFAFSISVVKKSIVLLETNVEAKTYRQLAYTDIMTWLSNRAAFEEEMRAIEQTLEKYRSIGFIIFDLNNLKENNDTYGHQTGDRIIVGSAELIQTAFQRMGVCYRIGGDEFVVILKNKSEAQIKACIQQFYENKEQYNSTHAHKIEIACGYAVSRIDEPADVYALFHLADSKMYQDKRKK